MSWIGSGGPNIEAGWYAGSDDGLAHFFGAGRWWSNCGHVKNLDWRKRVALEGASRLPNHYERCKLCEVARRPMPGQDGF